MKIKIIALLLLLSIGQTISAQTILDATEKHKWDHDTLDNHLIRHSYYYDNGQIMYLSYSNAKGEKMSTFNYFENGIPMDSKYLDSAIITRHYDGTIHTSLVANAGYKYSDTCSKKAYQLDYFIVSQDDFKNEIALSWAGGYELCSNSMNHTYEEYNTKGQLLVKGNYLKGLPEGDWFVYNSKGEVLRKIIFKEGKIVECKPCLDLEVMVRYYSAF